MFSYHQPTSGGGYTPRLRAGQRAFLQPSGRQSAPWQCLYLRPEPQGHGALRLTLFAQAAISSSVKSPGGAIWSGGTRVVTSPSVPASISRLLSSPVSGSKCRSEEHTSELQSLMRISYAVFCLKKKTTHRTQQQ